MGYIQVAVDGPAGSGKTSLMKEVAKRIGYSFIDTGLMYRAFTKFLLIKNVNFSNTNDVVSKLKEFNYSFIDSEIYVGSENYMKYIEMKDVLENINKITGIPEVREFMVQQQRNLASDKNCILIGRDITTVVLPDANYKIYIDCSVESRAKRRLEQNIKNHIDLTDYDLIYGMIAERDETDKNRKIGPLKIAEDAKVIDNSKGTFEENVSEIINYIKNE